MICIICILSLWRATIPGAFILSPTCTITKTSEEALHTPDKSYSTNLPSWQKARVIDVNVNPRRSVDRRSVDKRSAGPPPLTRLDSVKWRVTCRIGFSHRRHSATDLRASPGITSTVMHVDILELTKPSPFLVGVLQREAHDVTVEPLIIDTRINR
jgi:hypothetical protein